MTSKVLDAGGTRGRDQKLKLGICCFPLSRGRETGRGLERVIEEFCRSLERNKEDFEFYDRGLIKNEVRAIAESFIYAAQLKSQNADCYFAVYSVAGLFPALLLKRPLITLITDLIPFHVTAFDNKLKYWIKRVCCRIACRRSDHLIVGSATIREELISLLKVPKEKISVVPWGLSHETYFPKQNSKKVAGRVAFLGEAKRSKGLDTLIRAFALVHARYPSASLEIASRGSELEEMKNLANEVLLDGSYKFLGFVPESEMNSFYNEAEVFVFPSRYGFGLSALEAMAAGTPTIVGATLDAIDFFKDSDLLVDPESPEELAQKILQLLTDGALRALKSKEAIEVARHYSWDSMAAGYLEVCRKQRKLLAERAGPMH